MKRFRYSPPNKKLPLSAIKEISQKMYQRSVSQIKDKEKLYIEKQQPFDPQCTFFPNTIKSTQILKIRSPKKEFNSPKQLVSKTRIKMPVSQKKMKNMQPQKQNRQEQIPIGRRSEIQIQNTNQLITQNKLTKKNQDNTKPYQHSKYQQKHENILKKQIQNLNIIGSEEKFLREAQTAAQKRQRQFFQRYQHSRRNLSPRIYPSMNQMINYYINYRN